MKVLMFGWEFPPVSSGGLGTACYGLTKGLSEEGTEVSFVVPFASDKAAEYVNLIPSNDMEHIHVVGVNSLLSAYSTSSKYSKNYHKLKKGSKQRKLYGENLYEEIIRFSMKAEDVASKEKFDIIHCHDWMTFDAGIRAKNISGKPLVVHVHATEFDRTGGNVNQTVYDIERRGLHSSDLIIAVSNFTKRKIVRHYGISEDKVRVVHNAVELKQSGNFEVKKQDKMVLFLGRLTLQKGPDYFLKAARRCLEIDKNIKFVVAGTGDMGEYMIEQAAQMGIGDKVLFAGFVKSEEVDRIYSMADVYVMPSISEPFGITPLEAMKNGTPVIISKQSGVSEVIQHCLKVDFWDIDQLANKILAVLRYEELHHELTNHGRMEIKKFNWRVPAKKCMDIYNSMVG